MRKPHWLMLMFGLLAVMLLATPRLLGSEQVTGNAPPDRPGLYWSLPPGPPRLVTPRFVPPPDDWAPVARTAMHVRLEVAVGNKVLDPIPYGSRSYLVVPRLGEEYTIRVRNDGSRRIVAIVSVDGLSVINGKPASEASSGYVVGPHSSILISGWRRDLSRVAAFRFEDREGSYAVRMGYPENVGVIGLVAFEERSRWPRPMLEKGAVDAPMLSRASGSVGETGTGYGRDIGSQATYVSFVRSNNKRTITYYYDTAEALRRMGVPVPGIPYIHPDPFPADPEFAPPPSPFFPGK